VGPVICAIDDSDGARAALQIARDLAARFEATLVLVHAEPSTVVPGVSAALAGQERLRKAEIEDAEKLLAWLAQEEGLDDVDFRAAIGTPPAPSSTRLASSEPRSSSSARTDAAGCGLRSSAASRMRSRRPRRARW
jgi:nucleotide-binding universal stress UspA family protein